MVFWVWVSGFDSRTQDTRSFSPDTAWSAPIVCALQSASSCSSWRFLDAVAPGFRVDACWSQWVVRPATPCTITTLQSKLNVKLPPYRRRKVLRAPGGCFQEFLKSAYEGDKVFSHTHRLPVIPLRSGRCPVRISVTGWVDPRTIVRPEGLDQWKISKLLL